MILYLFHFILQKILNIQSETHKENNIHLLSNHNEFFVLRQCTLKKFPSAEKEYFL